MRFLKYEFTDKEEFDSLVKKHLTHDDEAKTLFGGFAFVEVGYITLENAIFNEEGEVVKKAVLSPSYAVDILWQTIEPSKGFEPFEVYPNPCGVHSFAGLSYLYDIEYYNKFPELKPVQNDTI